MLEKTPGITVIGEADNGIEAIYSVNQLAPDILLLDIEMPVLNGIEVVKELFAVASPVHILVLSAYDDPEYIREALNYGAAGYFNQG